MENLRKAVINQVGGLREFLSIYPEVNRHGADQGINGFIYTSETVAFTKRNFVKINDLVIEWAKECEQDRFEFLTCFNCFKHLTLSEIVQGYLGYDKDLKAIVWNGLAWFALEEVCRAEEDREHLEHPEEYFEPIEQNLALH